MRKKYTILIFLIFSTFSSIGQNNPVENLTWQHWYEYPNNFFELNWNEPAQPHGELIGYNIYRNNELYRFQTENTIYNIFTPLYGVVSNCNGETFLMFDNNSQPYPNGIEIRVNAVYNPGEIESANSETLFDAGLLLSAAGFEYKKTSLFPNPTKGILNIASSNIEKIVVYSISGKLINEYPAASQLDLSGLSKGIYLIKLISPTEVLVDRIIIE
jgi:hypothetical protein